MGQLMMQKYERTNLFIIDKSLWNWAKYRARELGYRSVAEYLFKLIEVDKEKDLIEKA